MIEISVLHASYGRPVLGTETAKKWLDKAKDKSRAEYIICVYEEDKYITDYMEKRPEGVTLYMTYSKGMVPQTNIIAEKAQDNLLIVNSDDFDCPEHWDELLLNALKDKEDYAVKTQDGIQPHIMTLPIMDKKYYYRFHYIFYPGYSHMYADTELTDVATLLGRNITLDLKFPHLHYSIGGMEKDKVNEENDSYYGVDGLLYQERVKKKFDL